MAEYYKRRYLMNAFVFQFMGMHKHHNDYASTKEYMRGFLYEINKKR